MKQYIKGTNWLIIDKKDVVAVRQGVFTDRYSIAIVTHAPQMFEYNFNETEENIFNKLYDNLVDWLIDPTICSNFDFIEEHNKLKAMTKMDEVLI